MAWFEQTRPDRGVVAHGLLRLGDRRSLLEATAGMRDMKVVPIDLTDVGSIDQGGLDALLAVRSSLDSPDAMIELRVSKGSAVASAIQRASLDERSGFQVVWAQDEDPDAMW